MKEQSYQIKKEIQSSVSQKVNHLSNRAPSTQAQKQNIAPEIQKMNVENYSQFLKQYRMTVKPPLKDEEAEIIFCERFDKKIIHKSLQVLSDFIKQQKRRYTIQRKQQSEHKIQNNQYKVEKKMSNTEQNSKQAQKIQQQKKTIHVLMDKIILYTWQLSNIRTIVSCSAPSKSSFQKLLFSFHRLCIMTSRIYVSKWGIRHVTLQAMQIAYFNLLKNKKFSPDPDHNGSICCLIEALLGDTEMEDCGKYINIYNKSFLDIQATQIEHENLTENNEKMKRGIMNCQRSTQKNHFCKYSPPNKQLSKSPQQKTNVVNQKRSKQKINKKSSVQLELEWFIYIIQFCINNSDSFIKSAYTQLSNGNIHLVTHSAVSFMHFISLLLNKIINDRTTTEIVRGYVCPIQEVRNMYNGNSVEGKSSIDIKISWSDFEWVCQSLLKELYCKYKQQISKIWRGRNRSHQNEGYDSSYIECIMNILGIINCCNFLGGYNAQLQIRTTNLVMKFGLQFLELTYLIYELSHAKKRKITFNSADGEERIKNDYVRNLERILEIEQRKPNQDDFEINLVKIDQNSEKTLNQEYPTQKRTSQNNSKEQNELFELLPIQQGQIVAVLRMLCNLVHINEQAQKYFQDNLKYFRIVMSLTHENDKQLTMKNWAIVFLKNAAQRSVIMREQLQKLKIDIKVDEGNNLFM